MWNKRLLSLSGMLPLPRRDLGGRFPCTVVVAGHKCINTGKPGSHNTEGRFWGTREIFGHKFEGFQGKRS